MRSDMSFETFMCAWLSSTGSTRALMRYGIYLTDNGKKMHGEPKERRVAGRKGVRKNK
jgi:hypothetical protein|nr:MAG TPA: hypothetical protein [Caudoviricetes sp.]